MGLQFGCGLRAVRFPAPAMNVRVRRVHVLITGVAAVFTLINIVLLRESQHR